MPKIPIDYSKTIIYKLVCNDLSVTDCYVGHTTSFTKRKGMHKSRCCNENGKYYNLKVYQFIRENGGWDNWNMVQVEEHCCSNKITAEARERYWYEELKGNLNIQYPARTKKEWSDENKDKMKEQQKKWCEENKEKNKEKRKEYNEANKDKISKRQKEYNEINKERKKEYQKKYEEENKEKIKEYKKQYYQSKKVNPPL